MRALVLAAGRGERLRPLTDRIPKPLVEVGGRTLLDRHLTALRRAGIEEVVINTAHLAGTIHAYVGDGGRWGLRVKISHEPDGPLETGGGMRRALPLLGSEPFVLVNGDILTDFPLARLAGRRLAGLAHLVLVPTPAWKGRGDFALADGRVTGPDPAGLTYGGLGLYHPGLVAGEPDGIFPLAPLLERAMGAGRVTGERHGGCWTDVGTPDRLAKARELCSPEI